MEKVQKIVVFYKGCIKCMYLLVKCDKVKLPSVVFTAACSYRTNDVYMCGKGYKIVGVYVSFLFSVSVAVYILIDDMAYMF